VRFLTIFGLVALAEMATFFWVESRIGLAWALGLALTTALIGSFLVRRAGVAVLGRMREKWGQGAVPGRELSDGAAILVAGAFLISPGFLTDTIGFLLLVPWVRGLVYQWITRRFSARVSVFMPESGPATDVTAEEVIDVEELD
jgi:UPF0716 protein FxsA